MKFLALIVVLLVVFVIVASKARGDGKEKIAIRQVKSMDAELLEEWERVTDDEDVLGVSATRTKHPRWSWQIYITVAEFVRKDPLESELTERITAALQQVEGVQGVLREDREVWLLEGEPTGSDLVQAAGSVLDELAPELRAYLAAK